MYSIHHKLKSSLALAGRELPSYGGEHIAKAAHSVYAVILTFSDWRIVARKAICQLFANFPGIRAFPLQSR